MLAEIHTFPHIEIEHQQGVSEADKGNIPKAWEHYEHAIDLLQHVDDSSPQEASTTLHLARILRDKGMLGVHAHAHGSPANLDTTIRDSSAILRDSRELTQELVEYGAEFKEASVRRVYAEHGATIGCQARVLVYRSMVAEELAPEAAEQIREYFIEASEMLRQGNNSYYGASNAMRAAAFERTLGHEKLSGWLSDAIGFVSSPYGLRDFADALRTTGLIGLCLPLVSTTKSAMIKKP